MAQTDIYDGLRPATADDLKIGARVWYKPQAWSLNAGWCTVARIGSEASIEIKGDRKYTPSRDLLYLWVNINRLWVAKERVMFRVDKKSGEVYLVLLDTIRHPDTAVTGDKYGVGAEVVDYYRRFPYDPEKSRFVVQAPYQSLIGRTRGLQTIPERNRAQVLLGELEAETKLSYRVKTRR